jgi:hypothetical protein
MAERELVPSICMRIPPDHMLFHARGSGQRERSEEQRTANSEPPDAMGVANAVGELLS